MKKPVWFAVIIGAVGVVAAIITVIAVCSRKSKKFISDTCD